MYSWLSRIKWCGDTLKKGDVLKNFAIADVWRASDLLVLMIRSIIVVTVGAAAAMSIAVAQIAPPKVILLVGPPGSGKTTQARFLAKRYGIPAISMSDLLKKQLSSRKDAVSKALAVPIASGDLMPDEAAADLVDQAILSADHGRGFILDGFPNTAGQAKALDRDPPATAIAESRRRGA